MLQYDCWANDKIMVALLSNPVADEKMVFWMNHIVNAEIVWYERMRGLPSSVSPTENRTLNECLPLMKKVHEDFLNWLESLNDEVFNQVISYSNTKGKYFQNSIRDIVAHVINHSTHHRAQISARLRENNIPPPPTDYIFYLREL